MANEFASSVEAFAKKTNAAIDRTLRGVALKLFTYVITYTPVDTGRLRANWVCSIDKRDTEQRNGLDPSGSQAIGRVQAVVARFNSGNTITLQNNLPYAALIEYGGYPDPVKRGSWNKNKKAYEILSSGGFSRKAPQGMVRINVARIQGLLKDAAREARA